MVSQYIHKFKFVLIPECFIRDSRQVVFLKQTKKEGKLSFYMINDKLSNE